jgi:predicted glycogen debranching enzyme
MSFIRFDHGQLVNLNYSLDKEMIRTNRAGGYSSSTIIRCNTRKYHGLLVIPQPQLGDDHLHVMLSSLDETIIHQGQEFNIGIHKYPGLYDPKGHKYITGFEADPRPIWHYGVGDLHFSKESILKSYEDRIIIKYHILKCEGKVTMRFKPFLAFRDYHKLSKANNFVNKKYELCKNGASFCLYEGYDTLFLQFSKKVNYVHAPDWYYKIQYLREKERGYDFEEDLLVPGFFEVEVKEGDELIFTAGTQEAGPATFRKQFDAEVSKRVERSTFKNCLVNAAHSFICVDKEGKTSIKAGLHWFGQWGRDTFISLPGLTLSQGDEETFVKVIDDYIPDMHGGLFPNLGRGDQAVYNTVDASLWFIWALQQYVAHKQNGKAVWKKYKAPILEVLGNYRRGTLNNISMHDNGLIWAGMPGKALTWMDAVVDGEPVTPRIGFCVEINALWYNGVRFALELAEQSGDTAFIDEWGHMPTLIQENFISTFWTGSYLADVVNGNDKDISVRSNQIIAAGLPYSMLTESQMYSVVDIVKGELLTPRGLRTLSPINPAYVGVYEGDQKQRDSAYHQGTVWVWQLEHFVAAYLRLQGREGLDFVRDLYQGFEPCVLDHGISTISEIYDGNPPHQARGAISQAWSVSSLLRIDQMIEEYSKKKK